MRSAPEGCFVEENNAEDQIGSAEAEGDQPVVEGLPVVVVLNGVVEMRGRNTPKGKDAHNGTEVVDVTN